MPFACSRTSYHSHIKCLVRDGLLSADVMGRIPRSNIYRWKSEHVLKYKTLGVSPLSDAGYDLTREFLRNKTARRVFAAYVRIIKALISLVHAVPGFHRVIRENSKQLVTLINRVRPYVGLMRALRFFHLSVATYRQWTLRSFTQCFESLTGDCNRIFPNQLSHPQVAKLKELIFEPAFQYWPVSSIALHALRRNLLPLSLNTWYKYVHKLGLARSKPGSRRKKNVTGIRAGRPHQFWHADVTTFVSGDNVRHFIYLVADNFSRKILSWSVKDRIKAEYRMESIRRALEDLNGTVSPVLITDGGPENNLTTDSSDPPFEHRTALQDIEFSNSLIEAHNKIIKYNYLYRMDVRDGEHLASVFPKIINDFNNRPHISLGGLTPEEAVQGLSLDCKRLTDYIRQAGVERRAYNRLHQCGHCKQ